MATVAVTGSFDDLRFRHVRLLEEAAALGDVHVLLWSDEVVQAVKSAPPKFPLAEREYFVQSLRYVKQVSIVRDSCDPDALRSAEEKVLSAEQEMFAQHSAFSTQHSKESGSSEYLRTRREASAASARKKVLVTGCFDWLHTGHVRFFEEVSEIGDVYAVVGHDANIKLLKGAGHPLFRQDERRYMVGAIRYVTQALISTGSGWLDAEPEIEVIQPDIYAVNEDGDKPEKKAFCREKEIEYRVLKRLPKAGLTRRQSTALRGF
jgi:cytidyltransferase-like protein